MTPNFMLYYSIVHCLVFIACWSTLIKPSESKLARIIQMAFMPILISSLGATILLLLFSAAPFSIPRIAQTLGEAAGVAFLPQVILFLIFLIVELFRKPQAGIKKSANE